MKIGILEPEAFSKFALDALKLKGDVQEYNGELLNEFLMDKDVLFIRLAYKMDHDFLRDAPKLKYICSPTTGLNHIDLDEVKRREISIISLKGESDFLQKIRATPEHIFGVTIALLRNYKKAFNHKTLAKWDRDICKGNEIFGKKVGIIGVGRIGKILIEYFNVFGATVFGYDNCDVNINGITFCSSITELIKSSEIIIISINYSIENHEVLNDKYIDLMKDKWIINCSRGEVIKERYFLDKLKEHWFKGVAVDVISNENKPNSNLSEWLSLSKNDNIILTPHMGGCTVESMERTEVFISNKLINQL